MASPWLRRTDSFMRLSHLYTGLFFAPWMIVYAVSAFCLNHRPWFADITPRWEDLYETEFRPAEPLPETAEEQAELLLASLDLSGAISGVSGDANQLAFYHPCARGPYQVIWQKKTGHVVVKQMLPTNAYNFLNNLHFRSLYIKPVWPDLIWAISVDVVTISTVLWVISGVWLWARRPRKLIGGICLAAGLALFAALAVMLAR